MLQDSPGGPPASGSQATAGSRVAVGPAGLLLGEAPPLPLLSGALHHFQTPRAAWAAALDALVELGLPLVQTAAPWAVHERGAGVFDFQRSAPGERFERDLGGFLAACGERGLKVLLRVGPLVGGELTTLGLPRRILEDEACLARGPTGSPHLFPLPPRAFPLPSYASERFLAETRLWLEALAAVAAPYAWPAGPLVAVELDHDLAALRSGAYESDYHPDAIAAFREHLARRYPGGLPPAYRGVSAGAVEAPRAFDAREPAELLLHLDWMRAKEETVRRALEGFAAVLRGAGLAGLACGHTLPTTGSLLGPPGGLAATEEVLDLAPLHLYLRRRDYPAVKRSARLLAGSSRLPTLGELWWGGPPWWFPASPADGLAVTLAALMHGVRGFNLHMAVERDRWLGALLAADGKQRREGFEPLRRLLAAVRELGLTSREPRTEVGLVLVRDYVHLATCTSLLDPLPPLLLSLLGLGPEEICAEPAAGLEGASGPELGRLLRQVEVVLEELRVPFTIVDDEVSEATLARYRLLLVPSLDFIDGALLERLRRFVAGGGEVIFSPRSPRLERAMTPLPAPLPGPVHGEDALAGALAEAVARLGIRRDPSTTDGASGVELRWLGDGAPLVLFAANPTAARRTVAVTGLSADGVLLARDALSGAPCRLEQLALEPGEVRLLHLAPADGGA